MLSFFFLTDKDFNDIDNKLHCMIELSTVSGEQGAIVPCIQYTSKTEKESEQSTRTSGNFRKIPSS